MHRYWHIIALAFLVGGCIPLEDPAAREAEHKREVESLQFELAKAKKELEASHLNLKFQEKQMREVMDTVTKISDQNKQLNRELASLKKAKVVHKEKKEILTREAFKAKAMGMTSEQLINFIGKPSSSHGNKVQWWYYEGGLTFDTTKQEYDRVVQVEVQDGSVVKINFLE